MVIIILSKSSIIIGNFCKGVKIFLFSSGIIFGQLLKTFGDFLHLATFYWSLNAPGLKEIKASGRECDMQIDNSHD